MQTVKPKKGLGQHFLRDLKIAQAIADTVDARAGIPVLEIGPGMGVLTQYIIPKKRTFKVVELDNESVVYLKEHYPTASAADGSVYVSSTYNKAFTFGGKEVADPEGLTSACIVKYNEKGQEQWAVTLEGSAVVYALDTDADGTLYAAGSFMDKVVYAGTDGEKAEITSEGVYSAFIAKIDNNGKFGIVKVITPTVNEEIASKMGPSLSMAASPKSL